VPADVNGLDVFGAFLSRKNDFDSRFGERLADARGAEDESALDVAARHEVRGDG